MTTELTNRRALVTGGASGIGLACARALARAGAQVIVADRDGDGARGAAAEVGGEALVIDLSDLEAVADLSVDVDVLVNNAGVQTIAPVEEFDPLVFRRMIDLMVTAPFLLTRSALPQMYARGWGRVVNISSVHGVRASPYKVAYVTAKHALEGMSKVVALEGGAHGVTSNCVNPGYVRTPLVEKQIADQARVHGIAPNEVVERIMLTESAIKRLLEPEEVAAQVLWLCSESAGMVTGTSHLMDGGWSAR
ncbi:3-hydroxybutyrate dehydrogenase [Microbacterium nymphoidis]|jgi:3-hydroxybutyrate dehydrogenase|uniref:3-hydroxybutyrate dehydrogenase n=1 Tax=Microbacterium nymphoidis TaxID=2898586 RepID=UPI001E290411|nr:3-hydroxybutyrate dehydrogenase [Microbacterium nymphoidis]MCD2498191.1 3-hydroxybutyrate dehydrogenase [Microbacterium nymphoidis]